MPSVVENPFYPKDSNLLHSSVCINFKDTYLRYRDVFAEEGRAHPADSDLWTRLSDFMIKNNKTGYLIDKVTCHHNNERK